MAAALLVTLVLAPVAGRPLPRVDAFLPTVQSMVVVLQLVIAAMLYGHFMVLRARPLLALVALYTGGAAMATLHLLSFPGLFAPDGLPAGGPQTTAWLYFGWRTLQGLCILGYALLRRQAPGPVPAPRAQAAAAGTVAVTVCVAALLAVAATAGHDALPNIMRADGDLPLKVRVALATLALLGLGLAALASQRRPAELDIWLLVAVAMWVCEVLLEAVLNNGRYSVGWYAGRLLGLPATAALLVALVIQESQVHRGLLELGQLQADLRRLSEDRLGRQEAERRRVAGELHEDVAQSLVALKMAVQGLQQRVGPGDPVMRGQIDAALKAADGALASLRHIVAELRPPMLDDLGLSHALESLVSRLAAQRGLQCDLVVAPAGAVLAEPHVTAVFRIVEVLLTMALITPRQPAPTRVAVLVAPQEVLVQVAFPGRGALRDGALDLVRERALTLAGEASVHFDADTQRSQVQVALPLQAVPADVAAVAP